MTVDRTIFDEPHHQSLEFLATQALIDGNVAAAFKFADRRCRILPEPEAHCYVLRGEAFYQMGAKDAALDDILSALEVAPDDIAANRRMLAWGDGLQRIRAATSLIAHECNLDALRQAIQILLEEGQRNFANVMVFDDALEGWAVWENKTRLEISIVDGANDVTSKIEPDPFHPLGDYGHAASFSVRRSLTTKSQSILLAAAGSAFYSTRAAANDKKPKSLAHWPRARNASGQQQVTVIVPVYGDFDATRICLESLLDEMHSSGHRAILVNDATPDARIAKYLTELASEPCVEVLVNARNLGFIGATNRALELLKQGDVILLNADTIVPPGFINRLAAVARSSPDIGTVVPLSNDGFPIPDATSPIGSREEVEKIDAVASKINAHRTIDIPAGIGFCLYITRACLDIVGLLTEDFGLGYYEDVDFCLRARDHGFRNICAPSVYVGHAGSKSFGQKKRPLVIRNITIIDRRFPKRRGESAAFMAADPLQPAREAIERIAAAAPSHPRLLVTGAGVIGAIARERARTIASETQPAMIVEVRRRVDGASVKLVNPAGGMPQSVQFNLSDPSECDMLFNFVRSMKPSGIEILDPAKTPIQLVDLLLRLEVPYDIFIADAGLLGKNDGQACAVRPLGAQRVTEPEDRILINRWREITNNAQRILVPCARAEAFAAAFLPHRTIHRTEHSGQSGTRAMRHRIRKASVCHLGFVPVRSCAQEQLLISEITHRLHGVRPEISITVIGTTLSDIGLMRCSNAFVTGIVEAEEFERLADSLGVGQLFASTTQPLFGHPFLAAAFSSRRPTAYFDWSMGRLKPKKKDLPIDPRSSFEDLITAIIRWLPPP